MKLKATRNLWYSSIKKLNYTCILQRRCCAKDAVMKVIEESELKEGSWRQGGRQGEEICVKRGPLYTFCLLWLPLTSLRPSPREQGGGRGRGTREARQMGIGCRKTGGGPPLLFSPFPAPVPTILLAIPLAPLPSPEDGPEERKQPPKLGARYRQCGMLRPVFR